MTNEILAFWTPGPLELIVVFFVFFFGCVALVVGLIVVIVLYIVRKDKKRKELHRQVQKLSEKVAKLKRQQE